MLRILRQVEAGQKSAKWGKRRTPPKVGMAGKSVLYRETEGKIRKLELVLSSSESMVSAQANLTGAGMVLTGSHEEWRAALDGTKMLFDDLAAVDCDERRETFIELNGPEVLLEMIRLTLSLRSFRTCLGDETADMIKAVEYRSIWVLKDFSYGSGHVSQRLAFQPDIMQIMFDILSDREAFEHGIYLTEDLLATREDTFCLCQIPNIDQFILNLSPSSLALFCRVLTLTLFEPEERQNTESLRILRAKELLEKRMSLTGSQVRVTDKNHALLLSIPELASRLVQLVSLRPDINFEKLRVAYQGAAFPAPESPIGLNPETSGRNADLSEDTEDSWEMLRTRAVRRGREQSDSGLLSVDNILMTEISDFPFGDFFPRSLRESTGQRGPLPGDGQTSQVENVLISATSSEAAATFAGLLGISQDTIDIGQSNPNVASENIPSPSLLRQSPNTALTGNSLSVDAQVQDGMPRIVAISHDPEQARDELYLWRDDFASFISRSSSAPGGLGQDITMLDSEIRDIDSARAYLRSHLISEAPVLLAASTADLAVAPSELDRNTSHPDGSASQASHSHAVHIAEPSAATDHAAISSFIADPRFNQNGFQDEVEELSRRLDMLLERNRDLYRAFHNRGSQSQVGARTRASQVERAERQRYDEELRIWATINGAIEQISGPENMTQRIYLERYQHEQEHEHEDDQSGLPEPRPSNGVSLASAIFNNHYGEDTNDHMTVGNIQGGHDVQDLDGLGEATASRSTVLASYEVEVLFVICTLLGGRRKIDAQEAFTNAGLVPALDSLCDFIDWKELCTYSSHPHGVDCECNPESILRVQFLRLLHNYFERDSNKAVVRQHLLSRTELLQVAEYELEHGKLGGNGKLPRVSTFETRSMTEPPLLKYANENGISVNPDSSHSFNKTSDSLRHGSKTELEAISDTSRPPNSESGFLDRLVDIFITCSANASYRVGLASCLESYLRGSGRAEQTIIAQRGLLEFLLKQVTAERTEATSGSTLQTTYDLLGELCKFNRQVFIMMNKILKREEGSVKRLLASMTSNLVDSNVFMRSMILSLERFCLEDLAGTNDTPYDFANCKMSNLIDLNRVRLLCDLMSCVMVEDVNQENICCLNTSLVIFIFADSRDEMEDLLQAVDHMHESDMREALLLRSYSKPVNGSVRGHRENFRNLLEFWEDYYRYRGIDVLSLESSSCIPFSEWSRVVTKLRTLL